MTSENTGVEQRTPTRTTSDDVYREPMRVANLAYADAIDGPVDPFRAAVRAAVDAARADERSRIVAGLRAEAERRPKRVIFGGGEVDAARSLGLKLGADLIERGEFDDVAADDE